MYGPMMQSTLFALKTIDYRFDNLNTKETNIRDHAFTINGTSLP